MNKIVLATNNSGKITELTDLLKDFPASLVPQSNFNFEEAEETGLTFVENAILKARNAAKHTGLPAIADDSGIEVDFLNGKPGIYSARYAGIGASDLENNEKLLSALAGVTNRTASFRCVLVYLKHQFDPSPIIAEGSWRGEIMTDFKGINGFGYDPIFWVAEHQCSSAQLSKSAKNKLSHRGKALIELQEKLI